MGLAHLSHFEPIAKKEPARGLATWRDFSLSLGFPSLGGATGDVVKWAGALPAAALQETAAGGGLLSLPDKFLQLRTVRQLILS